MILMCIARKKQTKDLRRVSSHRVRWRLFLKRITHCSFMGRVMHKKLWERWVSLGSMLLRRRIFPAQSVSGSTFRKKESSSWLGMLLGEFWSSLEVCTCLAQISRKESRFVGVRWISIHFIFCYERRKCKFEYSETMRGISLALFEHSSLQCSQFSLIIISTKINIIAGCRWVHERVGSVSCAFLMEKVSFCFVCTVK